MNLAVILPTINLWGGVKRFLELGNIFVARGHNFSVYTPEGTPPSWFAYNGETKSFASLPSSDHDVLFATEVKFLNLLKSSRATHKVFYHVLEREDLRQVLGDPEIKIFVNSTNLYRHDIRKYRIYPFKAVGGVDFGGFTPKDHGLRSGPTTILTYGRLTMRRKGTRFVVKACERLYRKGYDIRLILFDTPLDEKSQSLIDNFSCSLPYKFITNHPVAENNSLFHQADIFASAEHSAGWANTCAEAMAARLPVVATDSGTKDFLKNDVTGIIVRRNSYSVARGLKRLLDSPELAARLADAGNRRVRNFDWTVLADKILRYFQNENQDSESWT